MKRYLSFLIILCVSTRVFAATHPCLIPGGMVEHVMKSALTHLPGKIKENLGKLEMRLVSVTSVSEEMANTLAAKDFSAQKGIILPLDEITKTYTEHHVQNLMVEYIYTNPQGKKNVYLASSFINDNECSVEFQGYLIVEQNF